jgi:two-component system chemotaxis sensor kinase CheA
MTADRLAARLLATFIGELDEQVRAMNAEVLALETRPDDAERLRALFRVTHTLKGAARAANVPLVEEVCHALEERLATARDAHSPLDASQIARLLEAADALADVAARLRNGVALADSPLARLRDELRAEPRSDEIDGERERAAPPSADTSLGAAAAAPGVSATVTADRGEDQVRVQAAKLDALLASSGQLAITTGQVAVRPTELEVLVELAERIAAQWRVTRRRARVTQQRGGDSSRLSSALRELDGQLTDLTRQASRLAAAATADVRALERAAGEVVERARAMRLRPFADCCEVLPRAVRDLAVAAGKEARLEVRGADVEADRAVLDGMREALLHLVRNAVDHGIEPADARERAGKPRQGTVIVSASLRGDRLVVAVSDDGAGMDAHALRAQLTRLGHAAPDDHRDLARALLATSGVSTREAASVVSGRGVGLDAARASVERLGGHLELMWEERRGTTVTIEAPLALATVRALLVTAGGQLFAVPMAHVERVLRVTPESVRRADGREMIAADGAPVPLVSLARLLGPPLTDAPPAGPLPAVVLSVGGMRLGVTVESLVAEQELTVRPLPGAARMIPHFGGAALLGTGRVGLLINPATLVPAGVGAAPDVARASHPDPAMRARHRVLVVDDSMTTRTLEQSVLEAAGYDVATAVDGAEAWRLLQESAYDAVVTDVEMPRMDGFALCEAIRASKRLAQLPVVLVTALESTEHRARGLEAGADAYLAKSSFEQETLLETLAQLLGPAAS